MLWFVLVFLSVYMLMNIYAYKRLFSPLGGSFKVLGLMLVSYGWLSPILWRWADGNLSAGVTFSLAFTSLLWMGFVVYVVFFSMLFDLYKLMANMLKLPRLSAKSTALAVFVLSLLLSVYSYYETLRLRVERIVFYTDKIPKGSRIKVLHISDLHLGPVMGMDKVRLVLDVYNRERPDMVVSTGDLVDGSMKGKEELAEALAQMKPPLGKYAVLGNHEYYRGWLQAMEFTKRAGFVVLRDSYFQLDGLMTIIGVDDEDCKLVNACTGVDEVRLVKETPKIGYVLLLKHRPKLDPSLVGEFDLMLSGHTHGGVYYPVGKLILTKLFETDRGLKYLGRGSYLFVSMGVGTGGPPMRFLSPPDVAIVEIVGRP